jgi:hypothetical protein
MPCPYPPPWLDHSNYTWRRVEGMKLFIMQFSLISCHFSSHFSPNILFINYMVQNIHWAVNSY